MHHPQVINVATQEAVATLACTTIVGASVAYMA